MDFVNSVSKRVTRIKKIARVLHIVYLVNLIKHTFSLSSTNDDENYGLAQIFLRKSRAIL